MARWFNYLSRRAFADDEGGVNESFHVKTRHVGKRNTAEHPYLIANEWIAAEIAWFLRLPVAPHALMMKRDRRTRMFVSLNFDRETRPRDVDAPILWKAKRDLCVGILMFDVLIANVDRHEGNIKADKPDNPSEVHILDHERSLFYCMAKHGTRRLRNYWDDPGIYNHCIADCADTCDGFGPWARRIGLIPEDFIDEVCEDVREVGITDRECERVKDFIKHRRDELDAIVLGNKGLFPNINDWRLFL